MTRTLTALFDNRSDAEAAKQRLQDANIDISRVSVHDQSTTGQSTTGQSTSYSTRENRGFWDSVKDVFLPDEDRHTYEEGIRRGGALLTAQVEEDDADEAVRLLDAAETVDIEERSQNWRQSGWDYQPPIVEPRSGVGQSAFGQGTRSDADMTDRLTTGQEERIPVVEEELTVGKREVERGGVRVRSYVREIPVHEQVRLREEHVEVERRPVQGGTTDLGTDAFREREINVTETAEEAVVGKKARVVEEVVVRKGETERTEEIEDTVRRTEVEVDETGTRESGITGGTSSTTDRDRF